MHYAMHYNAHA